MTARKFKVGDRVVGADKHHLHRRGALGAVTGFCDDGAMVKWDGDEYPIYAMFCELTHYGQTLTELNVKAGDVVECVNATTADGRSTVTHFRNGNWYGDGDFSDYPYSDDPIFRIISRATDAWTICPHDYTPQDNHDVTYHMGVPTHYRVVVPNVVDVERRVGFNGHNWDNWNKPNATLRGQTRNGKPVGQWVIDMDVVE